jgi:hypothetical protein
MSRISKVSLGSIDVLHFASILVISFHCAGLLPLQIKILIALRFRFRDE